LGEEKWFPYSCATIAAQVNHTVNAEEMQAPPLRHYCGTGGTGITVAVQVVQVLAFLENR